MNKLIAAAAIILVSVFGTSDLRAQEEKPKSKHSEASDDQQAIEKQIQAYQEAFNASNADKLLTIFSKNAIVMLNAAPTAQGVDMIKAAYLNLFEKSIYTLKFIIQDIEINGETAYVRTQSNGTAVKKESGENVPDKNREIFIFTKHDGGWSISRLMHNKG